MSAAEMLAGAAPERTPDWHSINWKKVWRTVRRLQARIVKAASRVPITQIIFFSTDLSKSTIFVLLLNKGLLVVQTLQQRFHEDKALV